MSKLIGYARVSTRAQDTDRQLTDLLAAGVRRDDLYVDHGVSGARASRPQFDQTLSALQPGDVLVITTLDRLGRSTSNMLELADRLGHDRVALRVLTLSGDAVDTSTPVGSMLFTVMAALAQMELDIKRERINDSVSKRRAAGLDLGAVARDSLEANSRRLESPSIPVSPPATSPATSGCSGRRSAGASGTWRVLRLLPVVDQAPALLSILRHLRRDGTFVSRTARTA